MINKIAQRIKTKNNWLLAVGILLVSIALPILLNLGREEVLPTRSPSSSFQGYILSAIFIAPILEEIAFRGFFSKTKALRILAFFLLIIFVLTTSKNWVNYLLIILFLSSLGLSIFYSNKINSVLSYLLNATLFASLHFTLEDQISMIFPLVQVGFGLIMIWVVLNFGILKAILTHASWNFVLVLFLLIGLQFPDSSLKIKETDRYELRWQRVPLIDKRKGELNFTDKGVIITSINARKIHSLLAAVSKKESIEYIPLEPFMKYDMELIFKDAISQNEVIEIFLKEMMSEGISKQIDSVSKSEK